MYNNIVESNTHAQYELALKRRCANNISNNAHHSIQRQKMGVEPVLTDSGARRTLRKLGKRSSCAVVLYLNRLLCD